MDYLMFCIAESYWEVAEEEEDGWIDCMGRFLLFLFLFLVKGRRIG